MKREIKSAVAEIKKGRFDRLSSKAFEYFIRRTPRLKNFINFQKTNAKIEILLKKNLGKKANFNNISVVYILTSHNEELLSRSIFSLKKQVINPHVIFIDLISVSDKVNSLIKNYLPKSVILNLKEIHTLKDILNEMNNVHDLRDHILFLNEFPKFNELTYLMDGITLSENQSYCIDFIYPRMELKNFYIGKPNVNFYENLNLFRAHFPLFSKTQLTDLCLENYFKNDFYTLPSFLTLKQLNKEFDENNFFKNYFEHKFPIKTIEPNGKLNNYCFEFNKKVSIIILTKDKIDLLDACLKSIEKSTYSNYEVIVVDHNSNELSQEYLNKLKYKVIKYKGEFNFSHMNNIAVKESSGEVLCFLNNDIEIISRNWLETLASFAIRDDIGAVGAKLLFKNNLIQHAGININKNYSSVSHILTYEKDNNITKELNQISSPDAVSGACFFISKDKFINAGMFNEEYFSPWQDIDLCLTLKKRGLKIIFVPYIKLFHFESSTRKLNPSEKDKHDLEVFKRRWRDENDKQYKSFNLDILKKYKKATIKE